MEKAIIKEVVTELRKEEEGLSEDEQAMQKNKVKLKRRNKKIHCAKIKEANKRKTRARAKEVSHRKDHSNDKGGDGDTTTQTIDDSPGAIKGRKHKPLQALKAAALEESTGDRDTSFDNQKPTSIMIEDLHENGKELEKDIYSADLALTAQLTTPTLAKQRKFRHYYRRLCFGKVKPKFRRVVGTKDKTKRDRTRNGIFHPNVLEQ